MGYREEFPDFPPESMPDLLGWTDRSWRNDACPCFSRGDLLLWVNYPDPSMREFPDSARFILEAVDDEGAHVETLYEGDSIEDALGR